MYTTSRLINLSICTVFTCHTHLQTIDLGHLVLWFFLALGDHRWTISNGLIHLLVKLQYTLPHVLSPIDRCFGFVDFDYPAHPFDNFRISISLYLMFSSLSILQQVPPPVPPSLSSSSSSRYLTAFPLVLLLSLSLFLVYHSNK